jgi:hypothetical protein
MIKNIGLHTIAALIALAAMSIVAGLASAQTGAAVKPAPSMEKLSGVWVEGPGYDIQYGAHYDACAQRCLASPKCVMLEYYRPEKKCNHYDQMRPRKSGGSSDVGIRR